MLFIPLDNRPVCYDLPLQIAKMAGVKMFAPPKEILGGLTFQADFAALKEWTVNTVKSKRVNTAVIALDTIAYGGLVASRWSEEYFDDIISRINNYLQILNSYKVTIYAFSSVLRISNNNINEEEKDYWAEYGTKIFKYSNLLHKSTKLEAPNIQEELNKVMQEIPQEILEDYISSRERNFEINQYYLEKVKNNSIEQLVLCQDDTAKWGINVMEAETLKNLIIQYKLQNKVMIHPGTDEVGAGLITRAYMFPNSLSVYPIYTQEEGKEIIANYEDRAIKKSVEGQIKLVGAKKSNSIGSADLVLVVHLPEFQQGDHILDEEPEGTSEDALSKCIGLLQSLNKPISIADILWANGSDPELVDKLLNPEVNFDNLYGYSGWNTASNTIGSSLSMGIMRVHAEKENIVNRQAFKKILLVRFIEDWAYQSVVRQTLKEPDLIELNDKIKKMINPLLRKLDYSSDISLSFPWNRLFEVEVKVN